MWTTYPERGVHEPRHGQQRLLDTLHRQLPRRSDDKHLPGGAKTTTPPPTPQPRQHNKVAGGAGRGGRGESGGLVIHLSEMNYLDCLDQIQETRLACFLLFVEMHSRTRVSTAVASELPW